MGHSLLQQNLIERGICINCGIKEAGDGLLRCMECRVARRQTRATEGTRRKINQCLELPSFRARMLELLEWIGAEAHGDSIMKLAKMERDEPVRFAFFKAIWNERKWIIDEFPASSRREDLNELLTDCVRYAADIPDPIAEMRDLQQERQIETHDRSITALAMAHMDGMTSDDFAAVNHLY